MVIVNNSLIFVVFCTLPVLLWSLFTVQFCCVPCVQYRYCFGHCEKHFFCDFYINVIVVKPVYSNVIDAVMYRILLLSWSLCTVKKFLCSRCTITVFLCSSRTAPVLLWSMCTIIF